ncbi:MAG TPA: sensor histidine kinase [Candidatus Aquicultor sp.]
MSLSLNKATSKLKTVSEIALRAWAASLQGVVNERAVEILQQRVRYIIDQLDHDHIADAGWVDISSYTESLLGEGIPLDAERFHIIRDNLARAFLEQFEPTSFGVGKKFRDHGELRVLVGILQDSLAADVMSALFQQAEKLETEKRSIRKTLIDTTQLIEREGRRLAFDLHDGPAQAITSALLQADILEDLVASAEAKRELESLKYILGQSLQELRASIYYLKPHSLSRRGLGEKLVGYVKQFSACTGIGIDVVIEPFEIELPEVMEINIFRVIQEALTNVQKHAEASSASIAVTSTDSCVCCTVADHGVGFDPKYVGQSTRELGGYGLISMRDRIAQFSGDFTVESTPGHGTCIRFSIPI